MSNAGDDWLDDIAARLEREARAGAVSRHEVALREVLGRFGFQKRGSWINSRIEDALQARGLTMSPPIGEPWYVDETVSITREDDAEASEGDGPEDPTVRVEILDAADRPLETVTPDATLERAMTLMQMHDYSQLPVWSTSTSVKGVVSWKSIGSAHAHGASPSRVGECMERAHIIPVHTPLMEAVDIIYKHDCVLVEGADRKITGIVTAADLALMFKQLAQAFLLIGEIEQHLRNLVRGKFTVKELADAAGGNGDVHGPADLSFGGIVRLLQGKEAWQKLDLGVDRVVFAGRLDAIRKTRNRVMHFSLEAPDASEIEGLDKTAGFFRTLARIRRAASAPAN